MKWFKSILQSGISEKDLYSKKREVLLSNYIALILCLAIVILTTYRLFYARDMEVIYRMILGIFLFFISIIINKFSFTIIGRLYLCVVPVLFIWYAYLSTIKNSEYYQVVSVYDSLRMYLLAVSFIPYLLFNTRKPLLFILGILPTLLSMLFFEKILQVIELDYSQFGIVEEDYEMMQIRGVVAYIIINGGCFTFQSIIAKSERFNKKILEELEEKSLRIEMQNEELQKSHDKLNNVNQNLETIVQEKTENIKLQNERLLKYAHANSHHVRGPVARLLGLIQLLKLESQINYPWFFGKVEDEAKDIDEITRNISRDLDDVGIEVDDDIEKYFPRQDK